MIWGVVPTSGRRDVLVGADDLDQFGRVAARDALELAEREFVGIAGDAALATAERQVDDGALPRHPERQRRDLVERDARVEADAALGGAAGEVVLDPIARVDLDLARSRAGTGSRR